VSIVKKPFREAGMPEGATAVAAATAAAVVVATFVFKRNSEMFRALREPKIKYEEFPKINYEEVFERKISVLTITFLKRKDFCGDSIVVTSFQYSTHSL